MAETIALSLVSHTNVGKTTLARTLLARDIGEVRDAPHVTDSADEHLLLVSETGHRLMLWDTPGFGDSARLLARLRASTHPIGWFLSEVWDRWRDRPFWGNQQLVRHVREKSDVVLYLVNAAEAPEAAGYVSAEMDLLTWIGKPVLVLLNQLGVPSDDADRRRWAAHLERWPLVRRVLPLDAFTRCWVQEGELWRAVATVLPAERQDAMRALHAAWAEQQLARFAQAMQVLEDGIARLRATELPLADSGGVAGVGATLRRLGGAVGLGSGDPTAGALAAVEREWNERIAAETRAGTEALIRLHGLTGEATGLVLQALGTRLEWRRKVAAGPAAVIGGVLSGAATGLATDIASGGLTLGGGVIAGSVLGALGAAGLARGLNVARGTERSVTRLNAEALRTLRESALLRYLAVAHFGRGRGRWRDGELPAGMAQALARAHAARPEASLATIARATLDNLYPGAWPQAAGAAANQVAPNDPRP